MLLERGPVVLDIPVSEASSTTVEVKVDTVDTWSLYVVAPLTEPQDTIGLRAMSIAVLAGEDSVGAAGAGGTVVKLQTDDQEPVPPALVALVLQ